MKAFRTNITFNDDENDNTTVVDDKHIKLSMISIIMMIMIMMIMEIISNCILHCTVM